MKIKTSTLMLVCVVAVACAAAHAQGEDPHPVPGDVTLNLMSGNGDWGGVRAGAAVNEEGCLEVTAESGTYGWVYKNLRIDPSRHSRLAVNVRQASGIFNIKVLNLKGDNAWVEVLRTREIGQHIVELPVSGGEKNIQVAIYLTGGNTVQFDGIRLVP